MEWFAGRTCGRGDADLSAANQVEVYYRFWSRCLASDDFPRSGKHNSTDKHWILLCQWTVLVTFADSRHIVLLWVQL